MQIKKKRRSPGRAGSRSSGDRCFFLRSGGFCRCRGRTETEPEQCTQASASCDVARRDGSQIAQAAAQGERRQVHCERFLGQSRIGGVLGGQQAGGDVVQIGDGVLKPAQDEEAHRQVGPQDPAGVVPARQGHQHPQAYQEVAQNTQHEGVGEREGALAGGWSSPSARI